MQVHQNHCNF